MTTIYDEGTELWLELRKAWVTFLKADPDVRALVSAVRIYGEQPSDALPDWPFIRIGPMLSTDAFAAYGMTGMGYRLTTHVFSAGPFTDHCSQTMRAISDAGKTFFMPTADLVDFQLASATMIPDAGDTPGRWHGILQHDAIPVLKD